MSGQRTLLLNCTLADPLDDGPGRGSAVPWDIDGAYMLPALTNMHARATLRAGATTVRLDRRRQRRLPEMLPRQVPAPALPPVGCRFRPPCPHALDRCTDEPPLLHVGSRAAARWLVDEKER